MFKGRFSERTLVNIIILAILCILVVVRFGICKSGAVGDLVSNLLAEIIGALIVINIVDKLFKSAENRDREKRVKIAFKRLRIPLNRHIHLLTSMFKAGVDGKPAKQYSRFIDFFDNG